MDGLRQAWPEDPVERLLSALAEASPDLHPRPQKRRAVVIRVDLVGSKPPIWRRLRVASDLTLEQLHSALSAAMGWHGGHLHCFSVDLPVRRYIPRYYFLTHWDIEVDDNHDGIPESDVQIWEVLSARGDKVTYHYDFGDGWKHRLRFEKTEPWEPGQPLVSCLAGRRACPPEDCGGLWRYYEVLASLGPAGLAGEPERSEGDESEWFEEAWGWMRAGFAPEAFDIDEANDRLAAAEARDFTSERYL